MFCENVHWPTNVFVIFTAFVLPDFNQSFSSQRRQHSKISEKVQCFSFLTPDTFLTQ